MSQIFGFCGRKRSGKGVLSEIVKDYYDGVIVTAANYLKGICAEILGCSIGELNEKKDNGHTFCYAPDDRWYDIINKWTDIDKKEIKADIGRVEFTNIRQMLQVIGTDCIRKHNPDWHVNCMKRDIQKYVAEGKTVAVDDVRFPNERKLIEEFGGQCFFIVRPITTNVSNHISETSLTWDMFDDDHIIVNCNTLDNFKMYFRAHIINGFKRNFKFPIFLSEMPHFTKLNINFGKEMNRLVKELLIQNRNYEMFDNKGIFRFTPSTKDEFADFIKQLFGITITDNRKIRHSCYKIYNPIIIENLKMFL